MADENKNKSKALLEAESRLTPDQIKELQEAFMLFDRDGDRTISVEELGIVLRSLGQNPTDEEISDMIRDVDDNDDGTCGYDEFLLLMSRRMNENELDEEMMEAFKKFTGGKETIEIEDLRRVLKENSENLSDEDTALLFRETAGDAAQGITFRDFILMMMAK